jgi:hypothetical protein
MKDTREDSPRIETWLSSEPFSNREMPSVLRKEGMSAVAQIPTVSQAIRFEI